MGNGKRRVRTRGIARGRHEFWAARRASPRRTGAGAAALRTQRASPSPSFALPVLPLPRQKEAQRATRQQRAWQRRLDNGTSSKLGDKQSRCNLFAQRSQHVIGWNWKQRPEHDETQLDQSEVGSDLDGALPLRFCLSPVSYLPGIKLGRAREREQGTAVFSPPSQFVC